MPNKKNIKSKASTKSKKSNQVPSKKTQDSRIFPRLYLIISAFILFITTCYWSLLSARINMGNSDQLVNPYLLKSALTFKNTLIPSQHTFLFKWPIFYLIKVFNYSTNAYIFATIFVVLITVFLFVFILTRIEKRPLYLGTICLALASVLLMVPTQPYSGALLPVNMAMLATRNLEYILYIFALYLIVIHTKVKSWSYLAGILCLSVLFASDKLFFTLSLGGSILILIIYSLIGNWSLVRLAIRWFIATLLATALATLVVSFISLLQITSFTSQSTVGPYGLVSSVHNFGLGVIYALIGVLTNLGAYPAHNATTLREIPHQFFSQLLSVGGLAYVVNGLILIYGAILTFILIRTSLRKSEKHDNKSNYFYLSLTLVYSSVAAILVYCFSNHYYLVDSRYLTIVLFALFTVAATVIRNKNWTNKKILIIGLVLFISIIFGIFYANKDYNNDKSALSDTNYRNTIVSEVLVNHPVDLLVGDYWRVVPIKHISNNNINILPLSTCTQPTQSLLSKNWELNLHTHSFAYLLTLDKNLTNYPNCTIDQIVDNYGRPNVSTVIAGSVSQPKELLLFYDGGIHKRSIKSTNPNEGLSTIVPSSIDQLTDTTCSVPTIMNIVAHQDDDLLFMNPDILKDINAGYCVRSIYITAGDDGNSKYYWINRQHGSEAAYSYMLGNKSIWIERTVKLAPNEYVVIANPRANNKISLIFMHLPDGNINGQGFQATNYQSLASLYSGKIKTINSVDGESSYNLAQLTDALTTLMHVYLPAEINTQSTFTGTIYHDHSDHNTVGKIVTIAHAAFDQQQFANLTSTPLKYYEGYPIHEQPQNIFGADLNEKTQIFLTYAKFDNSVCKTSKPSCTFSNTYDAYLSREYQNSF